jgi:hypothetical protein
LASRATTFEDVIDKYAYRFSEAQNYLKASRTPTGRSHQSFEAATTNFTETSWTLDHEDYEGISGGEGIDFFGFDEDGTFQFLVGGRSRMRRQPRRRKSRHGDRAKRRFRAGS